MFGRQRFGVRLVISRGALGQAAQFGHARRDLNPDFNSLASHHAVFFRNGHPCHCSAPDRSGNLGRSSACVRSVAKASRTSASVALRSALDRQRPHGALDEVIIHFREDPAQTAVFAET
jgi:hypothetical protein